jgi:hypothetical protein
MPIVIPTAAEIDRMTVRQREALTARIPAIRDLLADTITRLERSQRMFPNVADLRAARLRHFDPAAEVERARNILDAMPADPDVEWHRTLLQSALQ